MTARDPFECPKGEDGCGELHGACAAHNRRGGPCMAQPMLGTDPPRCRNHLGRPPELVKAQYLAQRQAAVMFADAQAQALRNGIDPGSLDVVGELMKLADEAVRWKAVCGRLVAQLEQVRYRGGAGEQIRGEIQLYTSALERAAKILTDIARLGIEDRYLSRQRLISEQQADWTVRVIDAALEEFGVDIESPDVAARLEKLLRTVAPEVVA